MPELPVRSLADVHLADAFGEAGCPLCRERDRSLSALIESILADSVSDISFRRELEASRGLCAEHVRAMVEADGRRSGGMVASAILLRAILVVRTRELDATHAARGRTRSKRAGSATEPPSCPICLSVSRADAVATSGVIALSADPAWAEAAAAAPFCLDHLVALVALSSPSATWLMIEARQLERVHLLLAELEALAHRSSHDRRHSITDAQRASVGVASRLLGADR